MRRVALLLFVSVGWFLASAPPSEAAFVSGFTGNSGLSATPGNAGGWINFAVYDNSAPGANWIDDLGLSVNSFNPAQAATGTEKVVFFYQIVRNDVGDPREGLTGLNITTGGTVPWNGIGALNGSTFNEDGVGPIDADSNPTLGSIAAPGAVQTDGELDQATPFVAGSASNATQANINNPFIGRFIFEEIKLEELSSVVFLTSDSNVDLLQMGPASTTLFGVEGPITTVPTTTPEPGSFVLLGLAMVVGGAGYGWKRRKQKAAEQQSS